VNFTATATGGTEPYSFSWNFGDGSPNVTGTTVLHAFISRGTFTVTCTVTDSATPIALTNFIARPIIVQDWPVDRLGWRIFWNVTANDGINIWNVTYKGTLIIRDARLAAVQVIYLEPGCGPFYDEPYNMTGVKKDGNIAYENSTDPSNPYFQIGAEYRVGGYDYDQAFRFYPNGRWEPELMIGRGGCAIDHIYEPHWRIDLALNEDANNFMSMYTPEGTWQDLIWEGNYTDNGFRDTSHKGTVWRFGDQGRYYYIVPNIIRADLDLPPLPSDLILVRNHPNEIELSHGDHLESPVEFVNRELAFRRDIVLWFVPKILDHGPGAPNGLKRITLTFFPWGAWP